MCRWNPRLPSMKRARALRAHCAAKLKDAEEKVELIRAQEGRAVGVTPVEGL